MVRIAKKPYNRDMKPDRLTTFMKEHGKLETYDAGQVYHAQDFVETLFMLKKGYVKRCQITPDNKRVIELIYGPGHIFPLSQLYKKLFHLEMNQETNVYVYQAMTDIDIWRIGDDEVINALENDRELYVDLFYEAGLRLRSNIDRLASNALRDDYKKVAHQLACLAEEFGKEVKHKGKPATQITVPLEPIDMAEQLNISVEVAGAVMASLNTNSLIVMDGTTVMIPDLATLRDAYL